MHPLFVAALFTIAKIGKQPKVSIDGWMNKEDMVYAYSKILHSHEKGDLTTCNNMDGPWG